MSINCEVIPRSDATPRQLKALGTALARWCEHEANHAGIYHSINDQALNDLLNGEQPHPWVLGMGARANEAEPFNRAKPKADWNANAQDANALAGKQTVPFRVRSGESFHRQTTIASLRRDIPAHLVEDVLVDGRSWTLTD